MAITEALMRPFEMDIRSSALITVGTTTTFAPATSGIWPCLPVLLKWLVTNNASISTAAVDTLTGRVVIVTSGGPQTLLMSAPLPAILGFSNNSYGSSLLHVAENKSPYLWIPESQSFGRDRFWDSKDNEFAGRLASDGTRVGFELGPTLYEVRKEWWGQSAINTAEEAATDAWEKDACYQSFVRASRLVYPQSSYSSNVNPKGFYYVPNWTDFIADNPNTLDSGGINFEYTSSPDLYVFCNAKKTFEQLPDPTLQRGRGYYNIMLEMKTANAPTWLMDATTSPAGP